MTRERLYGSDTPFCAWMRANPALPSYSAQCGFVATDNDVTIHRYLTDVSDSVGTRDIQSLMHLEIKTRNGEPEKSQRDTLRKKHLFRGQKMYCGQLIWWWGVYFVSLSGTTPDTSALIRWGVFRNKSDAITWHRITQDRLIELLRFERHPDTFYKQPFRRHHKTKHILVTETMPLGFTVERLMTVRS